MKNIKIVIDSNTREIFVKGSLVTDLLRNLSLAGDAIEKDHPVWSSIHVTQGREANVHRRITGKRRNGIIFYVARGTSKQRIWAS